jgi:hypothetical protein
MKAQTWPEQNSITIVIAYLSIITLNINRLDSPMKRYRVDAQIKR